MRVTTELQDTLDFTSPYYYTQSQCIVRQGSPPYTDVTSMTGKKIGVVAQTTDYDFLTAAQGPIVKTYNDEADLFLDLKNGLIDGAVISDLTVGQATASGYHFVLSGTPYFYEPMAFAIRKGETDLLALLNYAIRKMHHDGSLTKYAKTWYHGADPTQAPSADIPSYAELMATLGAAP
jgi:polar amino acid transport system substrate-binding protein